MAISPAERAPRISVNDLALFMVSSDTARIGIIRRAKIPPKVVVIRYSDARQATRAYLADINRSVNPIAAAIEMFEQRMNDPSQSAMRQDDARASIDVLHSLQGMRNQLGGYKFLPAPPEQAKLTIESVSISIFADLLVSGAGRKGEPLRGAAVLRMNQSDMSSPAAVMKREEMGNYVAALCRIHAEQNFSTPGVDVSPKLCMSIDIQHGEVFTAPTSTTRMMNDIRSACRFIASVWPSL